MNGYQGKSNDKHEQATGALAAIFFTGLILSLCFAISVLWSSEKVVFVQTGKLNPNVASASELAELPSLGPAKAQAIVEYRQSQTGNENAFKNANDLEEVKGIGSKTIEKIKPWLEFN